MNKKGLFYFLALFLILALFLFLSKSNIVSAEWGDLVLQKNLKSMMRAKVKPVLFPHWFHRIRFKCKVCHEKIFIMEKGANNINMADIISQKFCGKCHNGNIAFSPKDCDRCHSYDIEAKPKLRVLDQEQLELAEKYQEYRKKYASKIDGTINDGKSFPYVPALEGETFDKDAFKNLEKDRFGLVDWVKAVKQNKIAPLSSIDEEPGEDNMISRKQIIPTKSDVVDDILFPHDIHTYWLGCEVCHDKIFPRNKPYQMYMKDFIQGKFCGKCHGKIAFPLGDCKRCHTVPKEKKEKPIDIMN
jgi:c(7)-type cytochrome triheme protein